MPTKIRPETSKKNTYYISKHRYYELKHFTQQYPEWKQYLKDFEGRYPNSLKLEALMTDTPVYRCDPTVEEVETREYLQSKIRQVDRCLELAFDELDKQYRSYILEAVTHGQSYDWLLANYVIPFSREYYYKRYRKFYWLLSMARK